MEGIKKIGGRRTLGIILSFGGPATGWEGGPRGGGTRGTQLGWKAAPLWTANCAVGNPEPHPPHVKQSGRRAPGRRGAVRPVKGFPRALSRSVAGFSKTTKKNSAQKSTAFFTRRRVGPPPLKKKPGLLVHTCIHGSPAGCLCRGLQKNV